MASKEGSSNFSLLLEAIVQHNSSEIERMLDSCLYGNISSWKDENSLDLVHHCILENNKVALLILLRHDSFQSPHEPSTWPYLHLAACLGYSELVISIVKHVKYHYDPVVLDWDIFNKVIKPRIKTSIPEMKSEDKEKTLSPIDVAALFGHVDCVFILICAWDSFVNEDSLSLFGRSPASIQLLVNCEYFDKRKALEYALTNLATECVKSLLEDERVDTQVTFSGMNMYHILYSSEYLFPKQWKAMIKITSLLIKHKQDVNALQQSRTLPLYSFLSQPMQDLIEEDRFPLLLAGLKLLLQAGADPNINEIEREQKLLHPESDTTFERGPHSSAIHCFVGNVSFQRFSRCGLSPFHDPVADNACQVIELLLKHKGDLNFVGHFLAPTIYEMDTSNTYHFGTALHLMLSTRTVADIRLAMVTFMLQNGLDADTTGTWYMPDSTFTIRYAINILPFTLWSLSPVSRTHDRKCFFSELDLDVFAHVIAFMSQSAIVMAYREFLEGVQFLRQSADQLGGLRVLEKYHLQRSDFFDEIVSEYEMQVTQPWSLQRCCSHAVWRTCSMRLGNVYDLPIPGPLKDIIFKLYG